MADTLHVGDVNIFNHDVESSFFSAFLESMSLNTEYGISGTPKRCVYVCNEIERIEHKYQLFEREIKSVGSNLIVVLDIDDRYRNLEIEISRRNESIFTVVVRMTSIGRVVSNTDLIKDIIQNPEKPISTIIAEFDKKRNNTVGLMSQFTAWIKTNFITPFRRDQSNNRSFETILKQKQIEDRKEFRRYEKPVKSTS